MRAVRLSAVLASNLNETNLTPAPANDAALRRGPMDDNGSHSISAPNQSAMPIIKMGRDRVGPQRGARGAKSPGANQTCEPTGTQSLRGWPQVWRWRLQFCFSDC